MKEKFNENLKKDIKTLMLGIIFLSFLLFFVNPYNAHIVVILLLPIAACIISVFALKVFIALFMDNKNKAIGKAVTMAVGLSVLVLFLLGSLKQLSVSDIFIVITFIIGINFYLQKSDIFSNNKLVE